MNTTYFIEQNLQNYENFKVLYILQKRQNNNAKTVKKRLYTKR